jgi:hypothetical protein
MQRPSFRKIKRTHLDDEIHAVVAVMQREGADSPQYKEHLAHLERLHRLKAQERRPFVSSDTIAICATNLLGILIIVAYENRHVITSKGFTHIIRPTRSGMN